MVLGIASALLLAGGVVRVPVGEEVSIPARGAVEARVVNPSLASVVRVEKDAVLVRGERAGETSVMVLTPEGYKEVAIEVGEIGGKKAPEVSAPSPEGTSPESAGMEPLPLTVFLGRPDVTLVMVPPLKVSLEADKASAVVDQKISLSIKVKANEELRGVELRLPIPRGAGYLLGSGGRGAVFDLKARAVVWRLGDLKAGESRFLPCEVRVLKDVPSLSFVAIASAEGVAPVESNEVKVKVGGLVLAAVYALPDTFVVRRNVFSALSDVRGEANRRIVMRLEGLGIVNGYPDRTFKPRRHATRAEAMKAVLLANSLGGMTDSTSIFFVLTAPAKVTVNVKDKAGRIVRTLLSNRPYDVGQHVVEWDGRDSQGVFVAPGVYTYEVSARTDDGRQVRLSARLTLVEAKSPKPAGRPSFKDVPPYKWYAGYIAEAERMGLAKGYPDGTFKPSLPINRAEFKALMLRVASLEGGAQESANQAFDITGEGPFVKRIEMAAAIDRFIDRDTGREATVSGAVSPGVRVSVNGGRVPVGPNGAFKCRVPLRLGVAVIAVIVR